MIVLSDLAPDRKGGRFAGALRAVEDVDVAPDRPRLFRSAVDGPVADHNDLTADAGGGEHRGYG